MTPQAEELLHRIVHDLERDRRNQALIDQWNRWAQSRTSRRTNWLFIGALAFCVFSWIVALALVGAVLIK